MSKKEKMYKQCLLQRKQLTHIAWVPAAKAICDKILKLKLDGEWEDGGKVKAVWTELPEELVRIKSREHTKSCTVTDI